MGVNSARSMRESNNSHVRLIASGHETRSRTRKHVRANRVATCTTPPSGSTRLPRPASYTSHTSPPGARVTGHVSYVRGDEDLQSSYSEDAHGTYGARHYAAGVARRRHACYRFDIGTRRDTHDPLALAAVVDEPVCPQAEQGLDRSIRSGSPGDQ